jgi:hypothetical protein
MPKPALTKGIFVVGLIVAILVSTAISAGFLTQAGTQGLKGDTGPPGEQGLKVRQDLAALQEKQAQQELKAPQGLQDQQDLQDLKEQQAPQELLDQLGRPEPQDFKDHKDLWDLRACRDPPGPYLPDYDSGWVDISDRTGQYFNVTHSLNTAEITVYITGKVSVSGGTHQMYLGLTGNLAGEGELGLAWTNSTSNTVTLYRGADDLYWNYVRVRVWRIE